MHVGQVIRKWQQFLAADMFFALVAQFAAVGLLLYHIFFNAGQEGYLGWTLLTVLLTFTCPGLVGTVNQKLEDTVQVAAGLQVTLSASSLEKTYSKQENDQHHASSQPPYDHDQCCEYPHHPVSSATTAAAADIVLPPAAVSHLMKNTMCVCGVPVTRTTAVRFPTTDETEGGPQVRKRVKDATPSSSPTSSSSPGNEGEDLGKGMRVGVDTGVETENDVEFRHTWTRDEVSQYLIFLQASDKRFRAQIFDFGGKFIIYTYCFLFVCLFVFSFSSSLIDSRPM